MNTNEIRGMTATDAVAFLEKKAASEVYFLSRSAFHDAIEAWNDQFRRSDAYPLLSLQDIVKDPRRACMLFQEGDVVTRTTILLDKALKELIEIRVRGVNLLNRMSLKGVKTFGLRPDAEAWVRAHLSERIMKADGTIQPRVRGKSSKSR